MYLQYMYECHTGRRPLFVPVKSEVPRHLAYDSETVLREMAEQDNSKNRGCLRFMWKALLLE